MSLHGNLFSGDDNMRVSILWAYSVVSRPVAPSGAKIVRLVFCPVAPSDGKIVRQEDHIGKLVALISSQHKSLYTAGQDCSGTVSTVGSRMCINAQGVHRLSRGGGRSLTFSGVCFG